MRTTSCCSRADLHAPTDFIELQGEKAGDAVFSKRFFADCVIAPYVADFDKGFKEKFKLRFEGAKK